MKVETGVFSAITFFFFPVAVARNVFGAKLKIISGSGLLLAHAVYAKDSGIKSAQDLVGKTIGTGPVGALLHQIMVAYLAKYGIKSEQVKFVETMLLTALTRSP